MPGPTAGDGGGRDEVPALQYALHPAQVLGRPVDLSTTTEQHHDLRARVPLEVDMGRRADVVPPPVLLGGQPPEDVRRRVSVEKGDDPEGVRVGVRERAIGELLADQRPDGVRPAGTVPLRDPPVEQLEQRRFERDPETDDLSGHVSEPVPGTDASGGTAVGGAGPNPRVSYPFQR